MPRASRSSHVAVTKAPAAAAKEKIGFGDRGDDFYTYLHCFSTILKIIRRFNVLLKLNRIARLPQEREAAKSPISAPPIGTRKRTELLLVVPDASRSGGTRRFQETWATQRLVASENATWSRSRGVLLEESKGPTRGKHRGNK